MAGVLGRIEKAKGRRAGGLEVKRKSRGRNRRIWRLRLMRSLVKRERKKPRLTSNDERGGTSGLF